MKVSKEKLEKVMKRYGLKNNGMNCSTVIRDGKKVVLNDENFFDAFFDEGISFDYDCSLCELKSTCEKKVLIKNGSLDDKKNTLNKEYVIA